MPYSVNLLTDTHFSDQREKLMRILDEKEEAERSINDMLGDLFDALDQCRFDAGEITEKLQDKDNRKALEEIRRHIVDAMNIVEDLR